MNAVGMVMMICSNALVVLLIVFCFYRVLTTPGAERHEHAPLDIDTRDADPPS